MASYTRLPKSIPQSLRYKPKEEPSDLVKARTHDRKADKLRDDDDAPPHLQYLERWKALEHSVAKIKEMANKELAFKLAKEDLGPHELLGHLIASLPRARQERIFSDKRLGKLNVALSKRNPAGVIRDNEMLQDLGITHREFISAQRDMRFQMGLQAYKSGAALGLYFTILRAGCDPKVKKKLNYVRDKELLDLANEVLRDVTKHIVDEMQVQHDKFFEHGDRKQKWAPPRGKKV
jgi:hypothetical protein